MKQKHMNISAELIALAKGEGRHPVFDGAHIMIQTALHINKEGESTCGMEWQAAAFYDNARRMDGKSEISFGYFKSAAAMAHFLRTGEFPLRETNLHGHTPAEARRAAEQPVEQAAKPESLTA